MTIETVNPLTHLTRLVRLAKLLGVKLTEGQRGTGAEWLDHVETIYHRDVGNSGRMGTPLLEGVRDGLTAYTAALREEKDAANPKLTLVARNRHTVTARALRVEIEEILYQRETMLANHRDAIEVAEGSVRWLRGTPRGLLVEVLAERGLVVDFGSMVGAVDRLTMTAPVRAV